MYDGQAQAGAAGFSGSGLVDAVEPLKDMALGFVRNAESGVLHEDSHIVRVVDAVDSHIAVGVIVLDAVFHEIEQNLVEIVLGAEHCAIRRTIQLQPDCLSPRQRNQHAQHALRDGFHRDGLAFLGRLAVQLGQLQQLGGQAGQAVRFAADVGHEFAHGFRIHLILKDRVGEELDGRKGRLELVGGV